MPNPTFFNLPEEKQQRLMDACWQEFLESSYMDASINRIVQSAGISRGSFYQYFSGKQDLFSYLLHTVLQDVNSRFDAQLLVHNNNLFAAILGMYDMILWTNAHGRKDLCLSRIHTLIARNTELDMSRFTEKVDCGAMVQNFSALLAVSGFHVTDPEELCALIHMLASICMSNLADTMRRPKNEEWNRRMLELQLGFIQKSLPRLEITP